MCQCSVFDKPQIGFKIGLGENRIFRTFSTKKSKILSILINVVSLAEPIGKLGNHFTSTPFVLQKVTDSK